MNQLRFHAENEPTLNGFLIDYLLDLRAKQAFSLIQRAFHSGDMDETVVGFDSVRKELGV